ncbi:NAD-dependent epimerase/dehydratase family protein [Lihuaxuella thermophila]|uniref:Nucleoside-diphosphate-sugar epimerase n=1 Tax=Lihuaxuella thermophila TaxID=1173111 RepID=A0A1H8C4B9_9BACL|nr:NAD-dependent epimerase/dehydratase family protein [Lihuaxuella thermophila]SEM89812.1 Nucleoside-diphosphate-sugar epimerase [Lihuaxuella thermophila]
MDKANSTEKHVVIGTGALGKAVVRELVSRGKAVRAVNRTGLADLPSEVEVVQADAMNLEELQKVCLDAAVIYNCTNVPYAEWSEKLVPMIENIISAAESAGAKLVHGDNLYMYGPVSTEMTEDLPNAATGPKGRIRAHIADKIMQAHAQKRIRAAIGRASNFYGPDVFDSIVGEKLFIAALEGKAAQVLGDPDAPHTYTFIDDFAKGLITLGEREEALGEIWHIPSGETLTTRQFIEMVYEEAGTPAKLSVAPKLGIAFLSLFSPFMRDVKEILYQFEKPFVMNHSKFESTFGANATPHREAIRKTLEWCRMRARQTVETR